MLASLLLSLLLVPVNFSTFHTVMLWLVGVVCIGKEVKAVKGVGPATGRMYGPQMCRVCMLSFSQHCFTSDTCFSCTLMYFTFFSGMGNQCNAAIRCRIARMAKVELLACIVLGVRDRQYSSALHSHKM